MNKKSAAGASDERDAGVSVQVVQAQRKPPSSYSYASEGRAGNPTSIYPKDFHVVKSLKLTHEQVQRIEARDENTLGELCGMLEAEGISGLVRIQLNLGGSGRKGRWETEAEYLSKPKPRQICKLMIGGEGED